MLSIKKLLKNPAKAVFILDKLKISKLIPDKSYLKIKFRAHMGKKLNLKEPKTFNEKLQWIKLYDRNSEYIKMVDKYEVKNYIAEIIGEEYIIPTLGVWDNAYDIDFDALPEQFVLKCTHDSGGIIICNNKSKLDIDQARNKLNNALKYNFYHYGREWPYKGVKPRIIAEQFLNDHMGDLKDYKMMCFGGKFKCCFYCFDRNDKGKAKIIVLDENWQNMNFGRKTIYTEKVSKPVNFSKMIEYAEKLSKKIPFLRVDFYEVNGKLYFGEITFFPGCGWDKFNPEEWDEKLGNWINLPEKR